MKKLFCLLLIVACWGCNKHNPNTEKHQSKRDKVVNVREKVKEIRISEDDVLIGRVPYVYTISDYLIIQDHRPFDKLIHLFDKNSFAYLTSIGEKGQGPDEITNMGQLSINEAQREFYVSDNGKLVILNYQVDSVLANPAYKPKVKMKMEKKLFPVIYQYVNDTICVGQMIEPIGNSDFNEHVARFNMNTGEINPMKYVHPGLKKNLVTTAASMEHWLYVECSQKYDLMTICSIGGDLKYNVYGPDWVSSGDRLKHYTNVRFCNNRILATYSGTDWNIGGYNASRFFVFDLKGNYIHTLETGYKIIDFWYDEENNRIYMSLDDEEIQFAYLDLKGLVG